jgi:tetratricopeptide (TPR) repeat protein
MSRLSKAAGLFIGILLTIPFINRVEAQDLQSAILLTRSERFAAANVVYNQLIQKNPNDGKSYYYFGNNYLQKYFSDTLTISFKEMADSATTIFQKGIQVDPTSPLCFVGLGEIALIRNDVPKAQQYFAKAIALLPSKANKTSTVTTADQALVYIRMASAYVKAMVNDTAQVFNLLRSAEKLDSKNPELYIVKGDAYIFLLNDGSKAIANYNTAQYFDPKSPLAKLRIGQLWMRARNYNGALTYYYEVIKIDSTFAPAYRELGFLLSKAGKNDDAKKNFEKFIRLSAGNITARIQYINTLLDLQEYNEAIRQINEIYKTDTSNNDLNRALGYSYYEIGQYDKGLTYMRRFLARANPEKIRETDYAYYGRLLSKSKMDSAAAIYLVKAFNMDTSRSELLSEAAMCYNRLKKFDKALEIYQMKLNLKNALPGDYYNLGKVYYNLKQWGKVDTILTQYNTFQPDHVQGYLWRARALVNIDSTSKLGLAKPVYEIMIQKARTDSVKNFREMIEGYSYLSYYYLVQYKETKDQQNGVKSIEYSQKVLAIDPTDEKAKAIIRELEKKIKP